MGTMRISVDIHEILTIQHLVMAERAGANGSKTNDKDVIAFDYLPYPTFLPIEPVS